MDMVFFPYNSMYSVDFSKKNTATTYAMKVNGKLIKITHQPYWKKDLLETSLYGYCKYITHDRTVFLNDYIDRKFSNTQTRNILLKGLTAGKASHISWPHWYARSAGYEFPAGSLIELCQYDFSYVAGEALLTDSISIYKTILP